MEKTRILWQEGVMTLHIKEIFTMFLEYASCVVASNVFSRCGILLGVTGFWAT